MGLCDNRDKNMRDNVAETKSMNASNSRNRNDQQYELKGRDCSLQLVAFGVHYVDVPEDAELLSKTVSSCIEPRPSPD